MQIFSTCTRRRSILNMIHSQVKHIVNYLMFLAGAAISEWAWAFVLRDRYCSSQISTHHASLLLMSNSPAVDKTELKWTIKDTVYLVGGCLWHLWKLLCILYSRYCVWLEWAQLSSSQAVVRPPGCSRAAIGHLCARPALLLATCAAEVCSRAWRRVPARAAPHGARRARTARSAARRQLVGCVVAGGRIYHRQQGGSLDPATGRYWREKCST